MSEIPKRSKIQPNRPDGRSSDRKRYIEILRRMTGEERARIGFELFEMAKRIMIEGMRAQNPGIKWDEIQQEVVRRMLRCHRRSSLRRSYKFSID